MNRILACAALCARVFAQSPDRGPANALQFEVASVKQVPGWPPAISQTGERGTGSGCPTRMKVDGARVNFQCVTVAMLIGYAFRISPDRISGPDWMKAVGSPRFNIEAAIPHGASKDHVPEMFQALLAERFQFLAHRGTTMLPAYVLVAAKSGVKLKQAARQSTQTEPAETDPAQALDGFYGNIQSRAMRSEDGTESSTFTSPRMGTVLQTGDPRRTLHWDAESISMPGLADLLDNVAPVSLPIIDGTGLHGRFQLSFEVTFGDLSAARRTGPPEAESDTNDLVVRAFNQGLANLGLRLEQRKGAIETIVVDRLAKAPSVN